MDLKNEKIAKCAGEVSAKAAQVSAKAAEVAAKAEIKEIGRASCRERV